MIIANKFSKTLYISSRSEKATKGTLLLNLGPTAKLFPRATSPLDRIFKKFYCSQIMSYFCQKYKKKKKKLGSPSSFLRYSVWKTTLILENYTDLGKLAHIIQHSPQGFIVKNTEGESTEANNLSLIL